MFGLTDRNFFMLAVVCYGASTLHSIFRWRKGFRKDDHIVYLLVLGGLILHTVAMILRGFSLSRCPATNLYEATTFFAWAMVASYLVVGLLPRLRFLGVLAAPIVFCLGIFALMPDLDRPGPQPNFRSSVASMHASLTLLAYGAFGLGSVASILYLLQRHDLKFHKARALLAFLPSIQRLESVTTRLLGVGFAFLTLGLATGAAWLKREKGVYFLPDPKILWSVFVWLVYLGLLIAHGRFAQRGRRFAWGAIASFSFVAFTFWGFNLLSGIHQR